MDKKVEEYLEKQQSSQKEIILKVRDIFIKTLRNHNETFAWGVIVIMNKRLLGVSQFFVLF